jgi:hypothetical protein
VPIARPPRSVGDIESFVTMMRVACENPQINSQVQRLLAMPDDKRRALVKTWVSDMLVAGAPRDFIDAIGCLHDDAVAEKTYEVIFHCRRDGQD